MSHIWSQTIPIDQELAKKLIENQTTLTVFSIDVLGEGFDNIAYLVNKEFIFRFPRRQVGIDLMENEIAILPYLAQNISFPFSCSQFIGKRSLDYAAPFAGYTMLPGKPLCETKVELIDDINFALTLAQWLKELHVVPILKEHRVNFRGNQSWRYDISGRLERSRARILQYKLYFNDADFSTNELFAAIDILKKFNFETIEKKSYVHGDLYSRHMLVNNSCHLTGLIDWGDVHIGNPGVDLAAGIRIFTDKALAEFFKTYGAIDQVTKNLAIFEVFNQSIILLAYCCEKNEENLKQWTILALKRALEIPNS